jgi:hypothetical protein
MASAAAGLVGSSVGGGVLVRVVAGDATEGLAAFRVASAHDEAGRLIPDEARVCHRIAELREQLGRSDEALAWHRVVLRDQPADAGSRAAVARLEGAIPASQEVPRRDGGLEVLR